MKLINITVNVLVASLLTLFLTFAPPEIPLYYARPWGEDQVANKWDLLIIPLLINVSIIGTYWFTKRAFPESPTFQRIAETVHILVILFFIVILIRSMIIVL